MSIGLSFFVHVSELRNSCEAQKQVQTRQRAQCGYYVRAARQRQRHRERTHYPAAYQPRYKARYMAVKDSGVRRVTTYERAILDTGVYFI